jgi:hypothetical protein
MLMTAKDRMDVLTEYVKRLKECKNPDAPDVRSLVELHSDDPEFHEMVVRVQKFHVLRPEKK